LETTAALDSIAEPLAEDQAQRLLRALAEPIRLQVLAALQNGERCVCDLTSDLDLGQSKLSFHLKVLKESGLIRARQDGRWIYYGLEPASLLLLRDWLGERAIACQSPAPPCSCLPWTSPAQVAPLPLFPRAGDRPFFPTRPAPAAINPAGDRLGTTIDG